MHFSLSQTNFLNYTQKPCFSPIKTHFLIVSFKAFRAQHEFQTITSICFLLSATSESTGINATSDISTWKPGSDFDQLISKHGIIMYSYDKF